MILLPFVQKRFLPSITRIGPNLYAHCLSHLSVSHHDRSNNGFIDFLDLLLQRCISDANKSFDLERPVGQIHTQIVVNSYSYSAFLSARLISAYAKLSLLDDARRVFDASPEDCLLNSLFWNSMLRGYVSDFRYENGLELYRRMRELNVQPDGFGFPLIIRACAMKGDVSLCKIVHSHGIQLGLSNHLHVGNEFVGMYGEIGRTEVALQVFDRMPVRSCVSWNVMMSVFAKSCNCDGAFALLCRMENEGWMPNSVTWTSLISSFARSGLNDRTWQFYVLMRRKGVEATAESIAVVIAACDDTSIKGQIMHGNVVVSGVGKYICVRNALISMYGRNGEIEKAEYLFSKPKQNSIVSWNALISAYAQSGLCDEAYSALMRLGDLEDGLKVRPNVVSWTAVVDGFAASGRHSDTLETFRRMQFAQVQANAITVSSVLSVCAELSAVNLGREIHAHVIRVLMDSEMLVTNCLINMYMKCGSLGTGNSLFEGMVCRDVATWNIMITGYGMHGLGNDALKILRRMVNSGLNPDNITFVAALSACSHSGLVAEGCELFNQMTREYQIEPQVEHYACMVDLYGRAGLLQEASGVLKGMPMEPNAPVWGALLNSCRMYKNTGIADQTAGRIFELESRVTGSYMLLSNIYAENEKWDDAASVRQSARTRGLKKIPGQSLIEVKKKVQAFAAGMYFNSDMEELHGILQELNLQMMVESSVSEGLF